MKPKLILIGGGGHCSSCIDVIEQENKFDIAGIVDDAIESSTRFGYPILGGDSELPSLREKYDYILITVGQIKSPTPRVRLFEYARSIGFQFATVISPRAYVSRQASIGKGTIVMHDALINAYAAVGNNCIINTKSLIEHHAIIEDDCHVATGAIINGGTVIGRGTFVGSNSVTREQQKTGDHAFIKAGSIFKGDRDD